MTFGRTSLALLLVAAFVASTPASTNHASRKLNSVEKFDFSKWVKMCLSLEPGGGMMVVDGESDCTNILFNPDAGNGNTGKVQYVKWPVGGNVGDEGPEGPRGERGDKGKDGKEGPAGEEGERGPKGRAGDEGPAGPEGPRGPKGMTGDDSTVQGPKGERGDDGEVGDEGPAGKDGDVGGQGDMFNPCPDGKEIDLDEACFDPREDAQALTVPPTDTVAPTDTETPTDTA